MCIRDSARTVTIKFLLLSYVNSIALLRVGEINNDRKVRKFVVLTTDVNKEYALYSILPSTVAIIKITVMLFLG